jgi:hypothetical protein
MLESKNLSKNVPIEKFFGKKLYTKNVQNVPQKIRTKYPSEISVPYSIGNGEELSGEE